MTPSNPEGIASFTFLHEYLAGQSAFVSPPYYASVSDIAGVPAGALSTTDAAFPNGLVFPIPCAAAVGSNNDVLESVGTAISGNVYGRSGQDTITVSGA